MCSETPAFVFRSRTCRPGAHVDLGPGVGAAWAPDDTAIAFMQPIDQAPPSKGAPLPALRARLAIATVGAWQVRVVDEVVVEIGPTEYAAPTLRWTPDGRAMYWKDA